MEAERVRRVRKRVGANRDDNDEREREGWVGGCGRGETMMTEKKDKGWVQQFIRIKLIWNLYPVMCLYDRRDCKPRITRENLNPNSLPSPPNWSGGRLHAPPFICGGWHNGKQSPLSPGSLNVKMGAIGHFLFFLRKRAPSKRGNCICDCPLCQRHRWWREY